MSDLEQRLRHTAQEVGGVRLHVVEAGSTDGPPVVLLHGFPEFWYGWRRQIGPIADAGFRVIVPDQRGYNTSEKPRPRSAYNLDLLARDVVGLLDSFGLERASLVGHDWGGVVAWWVAARHPERVRKLAILNAPHPIAFRRFIKKSPRQVLKSWYAFFFQVPRLPESLFGLRDWALLKRALRRTSRPGAFTDADLGEYARAWSQPGAMSAMINWYRAPPPDTSQDAEARIAAPTLIVWGARDHALDRRLAEESLARCDQGRLEFLEEATHWVQHEEPERVNRLLLDFLRSETG
ncbi:alpha/beta fold hydrolase [Planctomyces sp. SH-PL62]|uniref:alpha/beta fold hydrolase n=1 Tax=Planctomyces sp. SH-PL62 TaxID=1636152 RepID=UPI00078CC802|nr:alpha/beta hydrolase [Planctomyces sp. SH-PL62]AMV37825.1 Soluble epoxide hydrolase [Planctomyces sp. SH-PL62]